VLAIAAAAGREAGIRWARSQEAAHQRQEEEQLHRDGEPAAHLGPALEDTSSRGHGLRSGAAGSHRVVAAPWLPSERFVVPGTAISLALPELFDSIA
jgi:hypothetical protein